MDTLVPYTALFRFLDDPSLWDTAVGEMRRWGSSIHNFRRTATRPTELRGVPIAAGDKVVLYYASANRDEDVFDDPHTFDVGRTPNDHVAFGGAGCTTASAPASPAPRSRRPCASSSSGCPTSSLRVPSLASTPTS